MARPKKQNQELTIENEKELKMLLANYEMLERTKEEVRLRGNEEQAKRVAISQEEVIEKIKMIDASKAKELLKPKRVNQVESMLRDRKSVV